MSNVFITGGSGFIGSHLAVQLIKNHNVTVFDNCISDFLIRFGDKRSNLTIVEGDVLDIGLLHKTMKKADYVIHAAAIVGVDRVVCDHLATMKTNIIGTSNVLDSAYKNGVTGRVLVFSTSEIFGPMAYQVTESDPVCSGPTWEARWGYEISKTAGEHFAHAYHTAFHLPIVCVRPFNVYGPRQTMNGAMNNFIRSALKNRDIKINGDGSPIRSWCYVDDFVDCVLRCLQRPQAIGQSFNIGNSKTAITVLGLASTIVRLLHSDSRIVHIEPLEMEIRVRVPCVDKIAKMLEFNATTDLENGILRTAESLRREST